MTKPTSVYQYFTAKGNLLYVGVTDRGTRRLHEHADSKPWWHLATGCTLEHYPSREQALEREAYLIRTFRPPFNHQHNPDRHKPIEERLPVGAQATRDDLPGVSSLLPQQRLKDRRQAWYRLSKAHRRIAPCVRCGQRPGITGPECLNCRQGLLAERAETWNSHEALDEFLVHLLTSDRVVASDHRRLHRWLEHLDRGPCQICKKPTHAPLSTPDPPATSGGIAGTTCEAPMHGQPNQPTSGEHHVEVPS